MTSKPIPVTHKTHLRPKRCTATLPDGKKCRRFHHAHGFCGPCWHQWKQKRFHEWNMTHPADQEMIGTFAHFLALRLKEESPQP